MSDTLPVILFSDGEWKDGQILVTCKGKNFCLQDLPKPTHTNTYITKNVNSETPYPVYKDIVHPSCSHLWLWVAVVVGFGVNLWIGIRKQY